MIDGYPIFDLHIHTHLSSCGCQQPVYSIPNIFASARRLGFDGISFADHVGDNRSNEEARGVRRMEALERELATLDLRDAIPYTIGLEVDEGWAPREAAGRYLVLVSCNDGYEPENEDRLADCSAREFAEYLLARSERALRSELITMLPHPLIGRKRLDGVEVFRSYRDDEIAGLLALAKSRGVIIELHRNLLEHSSGLTSRSQSLRFCRLCRDAGVKLAFGTDSHYPWDMGTIAALVALAKFAGLGPEQFIPALPCPPTLRA